jgi:CheY-like chemotaxis protein
MKFSKAFSSPAPLFRILLIDDNREGLKARKSVLEEQGYEVVTASSPEDGLSLFIATNFDMVVTDYKMPRMNGQKVIEQIRAKRPTTPIVLLSGMVEALGLDEKNTGADVVVAKNCNEVQNLIRAVTRLMRKPPRSQRSSGLKAKKQTV